MAETLADFPADLERRFGGLARLYGVAGAQKIRAAHVIVVGLGGVGSWAAEALARSGVARLTLIDLDHIAESNINRQIHALDTTLGQAKVIAMRDRIAHINPDCQVCCVEEFVDASNWPAIAGLDAQGADTVSMIDACDQVRAKTAMAAWAIKNKINFISVGAAGGKRHAHKVDIEDLSLVTHDPLLAQLRYRLRKEQGAARKGKIGLACVFSREAVQQPATLAKTENSTSAEGDACDLPSDAASDGSLNCHGYGSVVSVTSTFGLCAAGWVLGKIAEQVFKAPKNDAII
ncbi:tRNA threonylcarbamoyladenosine dehydratase [Polaromonas sp. SM01]|uniref:tRNA threonylcarbamoyladenosine dehydratase n=1 Tax=Polaromonas sp. SM01 TaxID=3085630 RepID=UPI0029811ECA|nr:tRNA threonylcarbamoyladenosine dehydratase [Polaromonas sp. SM01]MDW5441551.1 tRNA threonylcarbamoyladenosine dehydratase [Polaromonas sp. SM01]